MARLDGYLHHRLGESDQRRWRVGLICDLYDWSLGLTWREARS
jgi:hypothetical protein